MHATHGVVVARLVWGGRGFRVRRRGAGRAGDGVCVGTHQLRNRAVGDGGAPEERRAVEAGRHDKA